MEGALARAIAQEAVVIPQFRVVGLYSDHWQSAYAVSQPRLRCGGHRVDLARRPAKQTAAPDQDIVTGATVVRCANRGLVCCGIHPSVAGSKEVGATPT